MNFAISEEARADRDAEACTTEAISEPPWFDMVPSVDSVCFQKVARADGSMHQTRVKTLFWDIKEGR
jgi:hypothetical protein